MSYEGSAEARRCLGGRADQADAQPASTPRRRATSAVRALHPHCPAADLPRRVERECDESARSTANESVGAAHRQRHVSDRGVELSKSGAHPFDRMPMAGCSHAGDFAREAPLVGDLCPLESPTTGSASTPAQGRPHRHGAEASGRSTAGPVHQIDHGTASANRQTPASLAFALQPARQ